MAAKGVGAPGSDLHGRGSMGSGHRECYREATETRPCPFCGKGQVDVTYVDGYVSWRVSGAAGRVKRSRWYHPPQCRVHSKCPECGQSAEAIRQVFDGGVTNSKPHEERLRRLREAGLPTRVVSKCTR